MEGVKSGFVCDRLMKSIRVTMAKIEDQSSSPPVVKVVIAITAWRREGRMDSAGIYAIAKRWPISGVVEVQLKRGYAQHEVNCISLIRDSNGRLKHKG